MPECHKCGSRNIQQNSDATEWFTCQDCGHQWFNDEYKASYSPPHHESFNSSTGRYEFTDL